MYNTVIWDIKRENNLFSGSLSKYSDLQSFIPKDFSRKSDNLSDLMKCLEDYTLESIDVYDHYGKLVENTEIKFNYSDEVIDLICLNSNRDKYRSLVFIILLLTAVLILISCLFI